jgi:addiction module HigA family antidote
MVATDSVSAKPPVHPGALVRERLLGANGIQVTDAARMLRVSRQQLHRVLAEEAGISPAMALRLGRFCGTGPQVWLDLQQRFDLWQAERMLRSELRAIPAAAAPPPDLTR